MTRIIIIAASVGLASSAHASPAEIVVSNAPAAHVSYADLDLNSAAGRHSLAGRIRYAADALCLEDNVEPLQIKAERMRCYRTAVANGSLAMNLIGR
jgi:UrcA family protein